MLFFLFIDYSGGIGLKYFGFLIALPALFSSSIKISDYREISKEIVIFILIPLFLLLLHLGREAMSQNRPLYLIQYLQIGLMPISSTIYLVFYPLIKKQGAKRISAFISNGLYLVSLLVIILYSLNVMGILPVDVYMQFVQDYRLGIAGYDPRLQHTIESNSYFNAAVIMPFISYIIPLYLGYNYFKSPQKCIAILFAVMLLSQRGLMLGSFIIVGLCQFVSTEKVLSRVSKILLIFIILATSVYLSDTLRFRLFDVFIERFNNLTRETTDISVLIRIGHIRGFINSLSDRWYSFFIGGGSFNKFTNTFTGTSFIYTELALINTSLIYGVLYTLALYATLTSIAIRLYRKRRKSLHPEIEYIGLSIGFVVMLLIGNTNPVVNTPLMIITYMILKSRETQFEADR